MPTHQHIQPSLSTYTFHRAMVGKIPEWRPSPLIIRDAQQAILRAHGDLDALVAIRQSQCEIDILLYNLIDDLSSGRL